ncbi:MAG: hypothetical protein GEU93_20685 [Propionibacteriales bacterium]|nr:hypothetical protein [Propionibacteriales bacterium]MQA06517.1 hypothetical protein [Streptosporangiales bacterium]
MWKKKMCCLLTGIALTSLTTACSGGLSGQTKEYPSRNITLINPYKAGGTTDPVSRKFAELLGKKLDAEVIVKNKDGGGSTVGVGEVFAAQPDGYTIGLGSSSGYTVPPLLKDNELPYKGVADFQTLVQPYEQYPVLVAPPDAPYKNLKEFVSYAKENPGTTMGSPGRFTATELGGLAFAEAADIKVSPAPFTGGSGESLTALQGGKVDTVVAGPGGSLTGLAKAGKVRVLGSLGPYRVKAFPDAESAKEVGYGEGLVSTSFAIIAPKGLPKQVSRELTEASKAVITSDDYRRWAEKSGYDVPDEPKSGDELSKQLKSEATSYRDLLVALGEKPVRSAP